MAAEIPEKQWAQVFNKNNDPIEYKQIPVPKPGPDEVLVNIKYTGVCHTDLHVRDVHHSANWRAKLMNFSRHGRVIGLWTRNRH